MSQRSEEPRLGDADGVRAPEEAFEGLRDRPTPELDSAGLWRRIEAQLAPRPTPASAPGWAAAILGLPSAWRIPRFAYALAGLAIVALAAWLTMTTTAPPDSDTVLVILSPEIDAAGATPSVPAATGQGPMRLDVRLVRGFDGPAPDEVTRAATAGVGGADPLRDARGEIEMLPFESYGVVGAWEGELIPGEPIDIELAAGYRLLVGAASAVDAGAEVVRLAGVELAGTGSSSVPVDLSLEPGRLYILGVLAPSAGAPELVLLVRAEPTAREP